MGTPFTGGTPAETVFREVEQQLGTVPEWLRRMPAESLQHFWGLMRDFSLAETKIPNKYKELLGIAVAGATHCRYCTLFHTEVARLFGATDAEIAEAAMLGGVTMSASTYLHATQTDFEQFARETREICEHVKAQAQHPPAQHTPYAY